MAWYDTGTVNVTANSATVTGVGTQWLAGARRGEAFVAPDGRLYEVLNIASNTSLTLTKPYRGTTASGQQYALAPMQGYVKELADRAAQLLSEYGLASDAEATALTSKTKALTPYGLGLNLKDASTTVKGLTAYATDAEATALTSKTKALTPYGLGLNLKDASTTVKGLTAYATDAEATALTSKTKALTPYGLGLNVQSSALDTTAGKFMTVGAFGLGRTAATNGIDIWPSASLDDLNVPAGMYYVPTDVEGRPENQTGIIWHRQAGTAGGQMFLSSNGNFWSRGRSAGTYSAWKQGLNVSDFGLGAGTVSPPNGRDSVNPFGWYYSTQAVTWGGGAFFLDMPYDSNQNAGLRLSTDPYSDNFYLQGGISGTKEYRPACKLVHDKNIVGDVTAGSVLQSGLNSNGRWLRLADGTQICFGNKRYEDMSWSGWGWNFPYAFVDTPIVTVGGLGESGGYASAPVMEVKPNSVTFRKVTGSPENDNWADFACIAIGRWF